jgi:hypothetical protein
MVVHDDTERESNELAATILAFHDIPAKCPQKNNVVAV